MFFLFLKITFFSAFAFFFYLCIVKPFRNYQLEMILPTANKGLFGSNPKEQKNKILPKWKI